MIFSNVLLNVGEMVIVLYEVTFLGSRLGFGMTVICDFIRRIPSARGSNYTINSNDSSKYSSNYSNARSSKIGSN